ncbi:cytochrome P450 [Nocardia terpenica]|uniref:Cytochrome P450 n=1 Tax=Nocardia terpenica TaxID=455432 RepID=A0A6G9ZDZ1_9NOCA|nr:cytochrome P450 [Nocardia terpenica]QIS23839.1 cytochrome P450 [Nocardia terpenica]
MDTESPEPNARPPRTPRPVLLHAMAAGIDFERYFRWRRARDGDPFLVRFPGFGGALFTGTPSGTREILRAPVELLAPPLPNPIEPLVGSASLILSRGERHRRERTLLAPAFHRARMIRYASIIREAALDELDGTRTGSPWQPGARVDARAAARAITLRVIAAVVFGAQTAERRARYVATVHRFLTAFGGPLMLVPALRRSAFGYSPWDRFAAARAELDVLLDTDIARHRAAAGAPGDDILDALLATRYDDGAGMSDAELREQLRTLLVAGHETTATTLVWALYRLHRNPATLRRLRAELAEAGADPAPELLAGLPYLDAVCQETLRLHPPVPIVLRRLTGPFTLRGIELATGDTMGIAVPLLHSDPTVWPDPAAFRPERFLDRRFGPFEYAPFGGGHRRCVGAALAEYELRIVLATVLSRVHLALTPRYARGRVPLSVPHNIATGPHAGITFDVLAPGRP